MLNLRGKIAFYGALHCIGHTGLWRQVGICFLYENAICSLGSPLMKKLFQVQQPGFLRSCFVSALSSVIRRTPSLFSLPALCLQFPPQPLHLLNHSWQLCSSWHLSMIPNYHLVKKKCGAVAGLVLLSLLRGLGRKWAAELRAAHSVSFSSTIQQLWWNLVEHPLCGTHPEPQHLSETGPWAGWL